MYQHALFVRECSFGCLFEAFDSASVNHRGTPSQFGDMSVHTAIMPIACVLASVRAESFTEGQKMMKRELSLCLVVRIGMYVSVWVYVSGCVRVGANV